MIKKSEQARNLYQSGEIRKSLKIVSTFRMLSPATKKAIQTAHDVFNNERFYLQTHNQAWVDAAKEKGIQELEKWVYHNV